MRKLFRTKVGVSFCGAVGVLAFAAAPACSSSDSGSRDDGGDSGETNESGRGGSSGAGKGGSGGSKAGGGAGSSAGGAASGGASGSGAGTSGTSAGTAGNNAGSGGSGGGATGGAGSGGAAGQGGSGSNEFQDVVCYDYEQGTMLCFGTLGSNNWAPLWPECTIDSARADQSLKIVGSRPAELQCEGKPGMADDPTGWDEIVCYTAATGSALVQCMGRLGQYWTEIFPDCLWADQTRTTYAGDPAEIFCGAPAADLGGWEELRCFDATADPMSARCYGRRGAYWVGPSAVQLYLNGLMPTCQLDNGGTATEFPIAEFPCDRADCPPSQPVEGTAACTSGSRCRYAAEQCECYADPNTGVGWRCLTCGESLPTVGDPCPEPGDMACYYEQNTCYCNEGSQWICI
ncbi:MAG TPA: hypothetical protein VGK73_26690 [Polyangiaceae bacterium]